MAADHPEREENLDTKIGHLFLTVEKAVKDNSHSVNEAKQRESLEWKFSNSAPIIPEAMTFSKEHINETQTKQENDHNCSPRSRYKFKSFLSPAAGDGLQPGEQDLQTSIPENIPLGRPHKLDLLHLASTSPAYVLKAPKWTVVKDLNSCPSARQLPCSPLTVKQQDKMTLDILNAQSTCRVWKNGTAHAEMEEEVMSSVTDGHQKEQIEEPNVPPFTSMPENNSSTNYTLLDRRISQMPIRRPSSMSISGILKGMLGYQQNEEDLEFLKHMRIEKRAIKLKAESLQLNKELCVVNQERELLEAKLKKIQKDVLEMQISYDGTLQLGRAFLCRQDVASAEVLPVHAVFKQLKPSMVQQVQQQELAQLHTLEKELKQCKIHNTKPSVTETEILSMKMDSYKQQIQAVSCELQEAQEEVETLKYEAEKLMETITVAKTCLNTTSKQIQHLLSSKADSTASDGAASLSISDEERQRMDRRLKRILKRKDIFLEREKLLQSFVKLG